MKQKIKRSLVIPLLAIAGTMLLSFSLKPGGDSFEIYVNKKLVCQHFQYQGKALQTLTWNQNNYNDQVDIYYSHCGTVGKNRSITVKDAQNKILKKWQFADAAENNRAMSCKVKDILSAGKGATLYLYYASKELPEGKLLAAIKGS